MDYLDFLQSKIDIAPETGIMVSPDEVHPGKVSKDKQGGAAP